MPRGKSARKRVRTIRHFGVPDRLRLRYHAELKRLLLDTDTKLRDVRVWLAVRDCDVTIGAICRYRQHLRAKRRSEETMLDEAEAAALRSAAFAHVARDGVTPDFLTACTFLCEMIMLKSLIRLQSWQPAFVDPAVLRRYCDAMDAVIDLRENFDRWKVAPPAADANGHAERNSPLPRRGRRGQPMVIASLPADLRRRYEREVLGDPKTTAPQALAWLKARGVDVSISSVRRHRVWLEQAREQSAHADAFDGAVRHFAEAHDLSPADVAAGQRLDAANLLLERLRLLIRWLDETPGPAPAETIAVLARALSALLW